MAFPAAAKQAFEKLRQGPVAVVFNPGIAGEVEVFVNGGVSPNFVRGQEAAEVDLLGTYDLFSMGDGATFELNLPEVSHNVAKVVFADQVIKDTATKYVGLGQAAGVSARASAKAVRIRPWQSRNDAALQLEFWKVVPEGDAQKSMTKGEPWAFTQTFRALPDLTKANGELIGKLTYPDRA